ncbi:MAG TPA: hypothetical protein VH277_19150, partial [Gemmatimonadaceae bacterium]|nr:hypothetical protein [Gemmatimonadaceae bacterium]
MRHGRRLRVAIVLLVAPLLALRSQRGAPCRWLWTAPETLLYHGAPFSMGDLLEPPHVHVLGSSLAVVGSRAGITALDTDTPDLEPLGALVAPSGTVSLLDRPPFIPKRLQFWTAAGRRGVVHFVWQTNPISSELGYASTDGTRWSAVDTIFAAGSPTFELADADMIAAAGDDVVVAMPATAAGFSGINVGTRVGGRWTVDRFPVQHQSIVELPLSVEADDAGAMVLYVRPRTQSSGGPAPGLYVRRRGFHSPWGPETLIARGDAFSPMAIRTADGVLHVFWRARTVALHHAMSRDALTWKFDSIPLPPDVQNFDLAPEGGGIRIVMQEADEPMNSDQKHSGASTFAWTVA